MKLAKNVQIKFNYKLIEMSELFKGVADWQGRPDKEINDNLMAELTKVESVYKGIVISGYPNNIVQADFIQKSGILPDRYFLL
jgi:adenylate kinase